MAPRAEHDLHALLLQEIVRAHDVVNILDLVVDVLHAGIGRGKERERVMDGVDAHQRRIADPVRHARVEQFGPELLVARRIGRAKPDMTEVRDAGVTRRKIAHAAVEGPNHGLDLVARRILERQELLHSPLLAFLLRAHVHRMPGTLDFRADRVEIRRIQQVEAARVVGRIAFEVHQRVIAGVTANVVLVGAEIGRLALAGHQLQADDLGCVLDCRLEIRGAYAQITDVVEIDHILLLAYLTACIAGLGSGLRNSVMSGREPHMHRLYGSVNGNCRGR